MMSWLLFERNDSSNSRRSCSNKPRNNLKAEEQAQQQAAESANIDAILRRHLSSDARARLTRIGLVDPKRAHAIKADLAAMLEQGSINTPMSDTALKQVLAQLSKSRSNASVRRI